MGTNNFNNGPYNKNSGEPDFAKQIEEQVEKAINSIDFSGIGEKIKTTLDVTVDSAQNVAQQTKMAWQRSQSQIQIERQQRRPVPPVQKPRELQPIFKKIPGKITGPLSIGTGLIGVVIFAAAAIGTGIPAISTADLGMGIMGGIAAGFSIFAGIIMGKGVIANKRAGRYKNYQKLFMNRSHIMLEDLQAKTGYSEKTVKRDVHDIVEERLLPVSYLDQQETCLIFSNDVYQQYLNAEAARKEREREEERIANETAEERMMRQIKEDEKTFLDGLESARASIVTVTMREKVDRLRTLVSRLYLCVKEHPEKYHDIYRVRDYYLPTVLKLLKTYEEIENQPIQGDNIIKTKQEIEKSLDMINHALEVMFDELFRDIAMDTSADISVLETMLSRDGWKKQDLKAEGEAPPVLKF